jgi:hypothetical protein
MHPDDVHSREDFIEFVRDLRRDLHANRREWESTDLDAFLEALGAYAEDGSRSEPTWNLMATLLWAGSRYE